MSDTELYKIPTVELSAKFLLSLSQLIIFLVITYWVSQGTENNIDYLLPMVMVGAALSLFLSVPNARMGVTLGIPLLMVVWGLATGENDMMFFAIFMKCIYIYIYFIFVFIFSVTYVHFLILH